MLRCLCRQQPNQQPLLCVHAIGRLLDDGALRAVNDPAGNLFATVRRTGKLLVAHEDSITGGVGQSLAALVVNNQVGFTTDVKTNNVLFKDPVVSPIAHTRMND